jgi:hypothetical protein
VKSTRPVESPSVEQSQLKPPLLGFLCRELHSEDSKIVPGEQPALYARESGIFLNEDNRVSAASLKIKPRCGMEPRRGAFSLIDPPYGPNILLGLYLPPPPLASFTGFRSWILIFLVPFFCAILLFLSVDFDCLSFVLSSVTPKNN